MRTIKRALPVLLLALTLAGCTTTTITKLSVNETFRNPTGYYSIEAALDSHQQTLRWESIKPSVIIGTQSYPMQPTQLMTNRWETLVGPIPPGQNSITYRIKFDYKYNGFAGEGSDSALSPVYKLRIMENR